MFGLLTTAKVVMTVLTLGVISDAPQPAEALATGVIVGAATGGAAYALGATNAGAIVAGTLVGSAVTAAAASN